MSVRVGALERLLLLLRPLARVEVVAAREIGRETVTYVRNVFSYYLAYRLVAERERDRS